MFPGPFFLPGVPPSGPPPRMLPSGLVLPDLSWAATRLGLVWAGDDWLKTAVHAYVSASEYFGVVAQSKGVGFEPQVWIETLLRIPPAEEYLFHLARLNRIAHSANEVSVLEQRFLQQLTHNLRPIAKRAFGGLNGGPTRLFLARQPVLRAMYLALNTPVPDKDPDPGIAHYLHTIGPESAAIVLTHLAADTLTQPRPVNEPQLGGTDESFAMEMICNHIFNEPHDTGAMLGRAWAMWTRHGAQLVNTPLGKSAVDLLAEATGGLTLAEVLAVGFAYWLANASDRLDGPTRFDAFSMMKLPREKVELFLDRFATDVAELRAGLAANPAPWQMLPVQRRPLLRLGDEIIVLDESFLLEAITDGLYWRVFDHLETDKVMRSQWEGEYGKHVIEPFAEELIQQIAPVIIGGPSAYFEEEDIKSAFKVKKGITPPNTDAGVEFPDATVLFEVVKKPMSVPAREGSVTRFKTDVQAAVFQKTGQLHTVASFMLQDPQPAASPLSKPAAKVFPIVVAGNHFPLNPVTWSYIRDELNSRGLLQQEGVQRLSIVDLDELEVFGSLARAGELLPEVLADWHGGDFGKGSFSPYVWKKYGGHPLRRSVQAEKNLIEAWAAFLPLLVISPE